MSSNYKILKNTWKNTCEVHKENYFVSYAVRGPMMVRSYALRDGLPVNHPIKGPVSEPSPLNNTWNTEIINKPLNDTGIC